MMRALYCRLFVSGGVLAVMALVSSIFSATAVAQYEDLYLRVRRSVVLIHGPVLTGGTSQGSGFIVGPSGYILTNHHVIEGMTQINVMLFGGRTVQARLLGFILDMRYRRHVVERVVDLAVLKVDAGPLPAVQLGDSNLLREGQQIIVLGFPGHVPTDHVSIVRGIVSAVHDGWVQTDAAFDSGNSGGPVLDLAGRVVGLATLTTGELLKLQGFVPINRVDALTSGVASGRPFRQSFWASGMEYVPAITLGRRVTYRELYVSPGQTGPPSVTTRTTEVTSVRTAFGAYVYTIRDSAGNVFTDYLSSEGLRAVRHANSACETTYGDNALIIPLPISAEVIGKPWKFQSRTRCSSGETVAVSTAFAIKSIDETLDLPTGRFTGVLHIIGQSEETRQTANGQVSYLSYTLDIFRAPRQIGDVLTVRKDRRTGETFSNLLTRVENP